MAVGIIIGGAFTVLVKSLVDNVFMPPLGALMAQVDFKNLTWILVEADAEAGTKAVVISYGQFITDLISFMLMAFVVFIVIKKVIGAMHKEEVKRRSPLKSHQSRKFFSRKFAIFSKSSRSTLPTNQF